MKLAVALALAAIAPAAAAVVPLPARSTSADPSGYFIPLNLVEKIECGPYIGTGARIDTSTVITAQHVVNAGHCKASGSAAVDINDEPGHDFTTLRATNPSDMRIAISCEGYVEGREYFAVGYAFGDDFVVQHLTGTGGRVRHGKFAGLAILHGNTFPGMSGGPVVDINGAVVGIVNAGPTNGYSLSLSRPLADTYLCKNGA